MARSEKQDWEDAARLVARFLNESTLRHAAGQPFNPQYVGTRKRRVGVFIQKRPGLNPQIAEMLEDLVQYARKILEDQLAASRS